MMYTVYICIQRERERKIGMPKIEPDNAFLCYVYTINKM